MLIQAILLSILASLLSIEWMNGHFGFSRPILASALTGLVLGDLKQGIIIGCSLQLIFMGMSGVGAAVPPDQTIGSVIATALAILTGQGLEIALTLAVPVALGAQILDIFSRTFNSILIHMADKFAKNRNYNAISTTHYLGILVQFVRTSIIVFPAIYLGVNAVTNMISVIPHPILRGLEVSGGILPAVGFGMLLTMLEVKHLLPFFFIGFALATFAGFSTVGVTMMAVCIAIIIDYYKKSTGNKEIRDSLDKLMED